MPHLHLISGLNPFQIFDFQAVTRFLCPLDTPRTCPAETHHWTPIAPLHLFSNQPGELAMLDIYIPHVICPLVPSACSPRFSLVCCVSSLTAATTCVAILPQHLSECGTKCVFGTGSRHAADTDVRSAAVAETSAQALALNKTF